MKRMKQKRMAFLITVMLMVFMGSSAMAAEVSQGKCLEYNKESMLITIEEYDTNFSKDHPYGQSTGVKSTYNAAKAQIGIAPAPGDILRIAYKVKGTERIAVRVMNVSKQDLMKK